jgi:alkanesulfonate monooxygenase SsuD/methylene tetrahydromethanopterin reductase-like flavin-dependent oxidoreductase (luciferase family)
MRVGLFADLRNPERWSRPHATFYGEALDRFVEAERLGIDSVWLTEHHFFDDGYLPQPLTMLAAIGARTTRLRLGSAILVAPLRNPLDIAEQAAIVDLVSAGRVELGLGAGYRVPEFEAFGVDIGQRYGLLEDTAAEVKRLWEGDGFTPAPVQKRAPLWIGAHGPRGGRLAGRLGAGLLSFAPGAVAAYEAALDEAGLGAGAARLTGCANLIVSDDPAAAWPRIAPHLEYQWSSYARYGAEGQERREGAVATPLGILTADVDPETLRSAGPDMTQPAFDVVTPAEAVYRLTAWLGGLPVETVYFWQSIGGMPNDLVDRHVELLATEVAPALALLGGPTHAQPSTGVGHG